MPIPVDRVGRDPDHRRGIILSVGEARIIGVNPDALAKNRELMFWDAENGLWLFHNLSGVLPVIQVGECDGKGGLRTAWDCDFAVWAHSSSELGMVGPLCGQVGARVVTKACITLYFDTRRK